MHEGVGREVTGGGPIEACIILRGIVGATAGVTSSMRRPELDAWGGYEDDDVDADADADEIVGWEKGRFIDRGIVGYETGRSRRGWELDAGTVWEDKEDDADKDGMDTRLSRVVGSWMLGREAAWT
ncbi:hypothetical protein ONZ45_g19103 [Pleurotus djamor]|nr:hypothetical protein ONZ45_g19103 [Pleurotus djamor]